MAILSKIRERSLALILIIGLALFAFVLDPSSIQDFFNSSKINTVGEVNGETISRNEFNEALEEYKTRVGNSVSEMQASKTVWDNLIRQKIYKTQLEQAGITIGESDVWNTLKEVDNLKSNPQFQNEAGLFDENKLKEYLATIKNDPNQKDVWLNFTSYMEEIKDGLERTTYNNLISGGLGASLKEAELQYLTDETKITSQYVYVPYSSINDSLIKIKKSEIENYIKKHEDEFSVEASRDIKYVKFDIRPTPEDENKLKQEIATLIEELKNSTKINEFITDNESDLPIDNSYQFKNTVSVAIAEDVFKGNKGDVFGPYNDRGYFKISKITDVVQIPDSVKSSHIIIPFIGSAAASEKTKKTEEQAKKSADSILTLVKRNKDKFKAIADKINTDGTKGKGGDIGWVTKNMAFSSSFDRDFANYLYFNKKGDIEVVKTKFGFHIIRIDDQTKKQDAVSLATFARKIEASQDTENAIFQSAELFASELSNGKEFDALVTEKKLNPRSAVGLKMFDENIPGVGKQREIIQWAFQGDNEINTFKRFDIDNGYIVAILTNKVKKGLMSVTKASASVRPIIVNQKKAEMIKEKMNGATLEDIAKENGVKVSASNATTMKSSLITGVGLEPKVVGAMYSAKENTVYSKIEGTKGVFAIKVLKKELPITLPNYNSTRNRIESDRKNKISLIFDAIKKAAKIEDNRDVFYGLN